MIRGLPFGLRNPGFVGSLKLAYYPNSFEGLVGWYKAGVGITLNGATVSQWDDSSGEGNHATQSTSTAQPTYNATDANFNGHPSLTFDGSTDILWVDGLLNHIVNGTDMPSTIVVALKQTGTVQYPTVFGTNQITVGNAQYGGRVRSNNVNTYVISARDSAGVSASITGGTSPTTPQIVRFQTSGTAGEIFANGVSVASGSLDVGQIDSTWMRIGCTPAGSATGIFGPFAGEIAEIAVYDRLLPVGEQEVLEEYFRNKFATY